MKAIAKAKNHSETAPWETIPDFRYFDQVIEGHSTAQSGKCLADSLLTPVADILSRRSKKFRASLVELGALLGSTDGTLDNNQREGCQRFADAIEMIHAGSLVVDDIEDRSQSRRGQPCLHLKYGLPLALNAGNWMYFWPLLIFEHSQLSPEQEVSVYRKYSRAMIRTHCGQALDNGVFIELIPQCDVREICLTSMDLKTGVLTSLAMSLGAILSRANPPLLAELERFGCHLGVALQMFNDLGNLKGLMAPEKQFEDLRNRRPSWVWACASDYPPEIYQAFKGAIQKLPEAQELKLWCAKHAFVAAADGRARSYLDKTILRLELALGPVQQKKEQTLASLRELGQKIASGYG